MKKFTKVLMSFVMALSVFGFTACNDRLAIESDNVKGQNAKLQEQYAELAQKLEEYKCKCDLSGYATIAMLDNYVTKAMLQHTVDSLSDVIAEGDSINMAKAIEALTTAQEALDSVMNMQYLKDSVNQILFDLAGLKAIVMRDTMRIYILEHEFDTLRSDVDSILDVLDDFATWEALQEQALRIDTLYDYVADLYEKDSLTNARVDSLYEIVDSIADQVEINRQNIDTLFKHVNSIEDALSKTIYSMQIQGTVNPVFGSFALPVGLQSNVLMAYYGEGPDHAVTFPAILGDNSDLVYDAYALTANDVAMLNSPATITLNAQEKLISAPGKLYLTVNPNTADLTETEFLLVNSQAEESGIKLDSIVPSTDVLTWGYNRAPAKGQSPVGFYEATASLDEADIDAVKINIAAQELASAVKDAVQNPGKHTINSLATVLMEQVQLNNNHPRNGVQAIWTDSLGEHKVMSDLSIMATAVKPLSYATLNGFGIGSALDSKLPHITPLHELDAQTIVDKINNNANLHVAFNVDFNLDHSNFQLQFESISFSSAGVLYVHNVLYSPDGYSIYAGDVPVENVDLFCTTLQSELNATVGQWEAAANDKVKTEINKVIDNVNSQFSDMMDDLNAQANSQVQSVLNSVANMTVSKYNQLVPTVNKFINLYNRVYNKMISLLDNPNKLLQVAMFCKGSDGNLHHLSTNSVLPTVFNGTGAYELFPTSYTLDVVVPAYAKFVAVTNVWSATGNAQAGDAACVSALQNANAGQYLNTVLEGGRYGIAASLQAGFTYEIFYSAVDYSGKISQRKYYVTVK